MAEEKLEVKARKLKSPPGIPIFRTSSSTLSFFGYDKRKASYRANPDYLVEIVRREAASMQDELNNISLTESVYYQKLIEWLGLDSVEGRIRRKTRRIDRFCRWFEQKIEYIDYQIEHDWERIPREYSRLLQLFNSVDEMKQKIEEFSRSRTGVGLGNGRLDAEKVRNFVEEKKRADLQNYEEAERQATLDQLTLDFLSCCVETEKIQFYADAYRRARSDMQKVICKLRMYRSDIEKGNDIRVELVLYDSRQ